MSASNSHRRATPKQLALKKWPKAFATFDEFSDGAWSIRAKLYPEHPDTVSVLGRGSNEHEAWSDVVRRHL